MKTSKNPDITGFQANFYKCNRFAIITLNVSTIASTYSRHKLMKQE